MPAAAARRGQPARREAGLERAEDPELSAHDPATLHATDRVVSIRAQREDAGDDLRDDGQAPPAFLDALGMVVCRLPPEGRVVLRGRRVPLGRRGATPAGSAAAEDVAGHDEAGPPTGAVVRAGHQGPSMRIEQQLRRVHAGRGEPRGDPAMPPEAGVGPTVGCEPLEHEPGPAAAVRGCGRSLGPTTSPPPRESGAIESSSLPEGPGGLRTTWPPRPKEGSGDPSGPIRTSRTRRGSLPLTVRGSSARIEPSGPSASDLIQPESRAPSPKAAGGSPVAVRRASPADPPARGHFERPRP